MGLFGTVVVVVLCRWFDVYSDSSTLSFRMVDLFSAELTGTLVPSNSPSVCLKETQIQIVVSIDFISTRFTNRLLKASEK